MDRPLPAWVRLLHALPLIAAIASTAASAAPAAEAIASSPLPTPAEFSSLARRAGLRLLEGRHLLLATDRPSRDGDGVAALPAVFDEAFDAWCRHYGLEPRRHSEWKAVGCLVVDRGKFREAGLLPEEVPDFTNGFCDRGRFWMMDQSNPNYRRHLLLHEGVHAFTLTLLSLSTPAWYTEGIAEYLATHRLEDGRFVHSAIPRSAADVEQLGRIEQLQSLVRSGRGPSLRDVFASDIAGHRSLGPYAASWAAVAMLSGHPRHARAFAAVEQGPFDASFTDRLQRTADWDAAAADRDFAAFLDDVDYGYDFARSAIDWKAAPPLVSQAHLAVAAGRGWQHAGSSLEAGRGYSVSATGRSLLGRIGSRTIESGPDGVSLDWYRGRPVGRLLVAQWVENPGRQPSFRLLAEGGNAEFTAAADGPLYLRINEAPAAFSDSDGRLEVSLRPLPPHE